MAIKRKTKKKAASESAKVSEPNKEPRQEEESKFEHPVIVSFSMIRTGGGWVVVRLETQGDKVINKTMTVPELKAITFDRFRIMVAKELVEG